MAAAPPPAIAPAPLPNHHHPAQESIHDQGLRDHQVTSSYPPPPPAEYERAGMQASTPPSSQEYPPSNRTLDPAIGGAPGVMSGSGESGGDDNQGDGRKGYGKRELSTSKRAAQNRAAQRAFRQRKEGYIKKLEEQVRDYAGLSESYKALQAENYQLRDYIISLQSRLLESQGDYPQPPPNVNLPHPSDQRQQTLDRHEPPPVPRPSQMEYDALSQLRAAARQDYAAAAAANKRPNEPAYAADLHLSKRLKSDGPEIVKPNPVAVQDALQGSAMAIEPRISHSPQSRDLSVGSVLNQTTRERNNTRPMLST